MTRRFSKVISWSSKDQCYVVRVPELDGVITHGKTETEAIKHAEEAIELHLESLRAHNEPETKLVQLNMRTHTLEQVADVKDRTNAESTTAAIRMSIEIADMVTKTLAAGGKVILDSGSEKQEIVLPGLP